MTRSISVLILENSRPDFDLIARELRRSGFDADCWRAETEAEYLAGLQKQPDIILAKQQLSWQPKTQLKEGLGRTIAYFETLLSETRTRELLMRV